MSIFDKIRGRRDEDSFLRAREHVRRCHEHQHAGRINEALREAQEAIRLDPQNADACSGLGRCFHVLARAENDRAGGNIYFRSGLDKLNHPIAAYEKVIKLQPNAADGFLSLGLACDNACRLEEAERYYSEAMRLDPDGMDGADAHFNLALLLYMQAIGWAGKKQFPAYAHLRSSDPILEAAFETAEQSITIGERIVRHDLSYIPSLARMHRAVAGWYDRSLQGSRAISHYQAVLRLNPGDAEAIKWLTLAERNTGRKLL